MNQAKIEKIRQQIRKLDEEKGPISKELLDYTRKINEMLSKITSVIKTEPKDIPQISKETSIDSATLLWLLSGMVKYGKAEVIIPKSGYPKYKAKFQEGIYGKEG